jgi:exonuclease III
VSVHLKSGPERRSFDLRARSLAGLPEAVRELQRRNNESDVVIAGDLNTMGCRRCSPPIPASDELESVSKQLGTLAPPFRRVEASQPCSEYYADGSGLLDHFLVSSATRELSASTRTLVSGFCGEAACARIPAKSRPSVDAAISDHCPLVLELLDRDLD